jgi:hypothetical protein
MSAYLHYHGPTSTPEHTIGSGLATHFFLRRDREHLEEHHGENRFTLPPFSGKFATYKSNIVPTSHLFLPYHGPTSTPENPMGIDFGHPFPSKT